ncbi:MAG: hypothetical protein D6791_12050 [Chloroflexi bacterium]|nr:MAG: hypothetical protein D6791_12050 [Chloroflexota bacterium]
MSRLLGITPKLRQAAITVVMLIAMIVGSFSVTRVAAASLPTSPLYPVKRFTERVQLVLAPTTEAKAKLHLRFSQERLREAEALVRQTGRLDPAVLGDMLTENDQFLGTIKGVDPSRRDELAAHGVTVFRQQRQVLTELSGVNSPLSPAERAALRAFVGETGDDQAIAEEVQREPGVAELIPSPTPLLLPTVTPKPSPTQVPTKAPAPAKPTPVPPTLTPVPPTVTPTPVQAEVILQPPAPEEPLPTETSTVTATATLTATPTSGPVSPPQPVKPTATPTPVPPATATPAAPPATPTPTVELQMPTLPPPDTPVP